MKNIQLLAGMAAMLSLGGDSFSPTSGGNDGSYGHGIPDKPKKVIPKGCKEFTFHGVTVIALSEERAYAKYKKRMLKELSHV